jgi:hypothetical protein
MPMPQGKGRAMLKKSGTIHPTLTGYDFTVDEPLRPLRAIRFKCLECTCGSVSSVRDCEITDCTLWPFRMGVRPVNVGTKNPNGCAGFDDVEGAAVA